MSYSYDILCSVADIQKGVERIQTELDGIQRNIKRYDFTESLQDYDTAVQGISRLNVICENVVLETRRMLAQSDVYEPSVVAEYDMTKAFDYQIGYTSQNWLVIDIPPLLHKKGDRARKSAYVRENLRIIFSTFKNNIPVESFFRYNNCTVVFESIYETNKLSNSMYDYDSIELTQAMNNISDAFLIDDGMKNIRKFLFSTPGKTYRTRIYVVPNNDFSEFCSMLSSDQLHHLELSSKPHIL